MDDELFEKFRTRAVEVFSVEADQITPAAHFADDLDADSLDLVELVMALEDDYGFEIDEAELQGIETVGQALALVRSKLP